MAYNILGITPGHNGSVALVSDGELILYLEEERLSRIKYDGNPIKGILYLLLKYNIDELVITGQKKNNFNINFYKHLLLKFNSSIKVTNFQHHHHLSHASNAFYNSPFKKAASLVIDSAGSSHFYNEIECVEAESIFTFEYPNKIEIKFKSYNNTSGYLYKNQISNISSNVNLCKTYESLTEYLGWGFLEAGKTMGLSSYGKHDLSIPPLIIDSKGNPKIFKMANLGTTVNPKIEVYNKKNLAYHLQRETEKSLKELVQKTIDLTQNTNIVCAGGLFLNCVANYYLTKQFPHVNFYFEPTAHDGGNSIGAALYRWYEHSGDTTIRPRKTLYNGPKYSQEELLEGIKKYVG